MLFLIAFFSLIGLVVLHELGHFLAAKKFGVRVEEFGIGLPPRIFGKKIGETLYSLNLLPLGAFVRLTGEEGQSSDPRSFGSKSLLSRAIIIGAGVIAFWIISFFIFAGLALTTGIPAGVSDETTEGVLNPHVRVLGIAPGSPAKEAGLQAGDTVQDFEKVGEFQSFINQHKGEEIVLSIVRAGQNLSIPVTPRLEPPAGEGPLGIQLVRTGNMQYPWYEAPVVAFQKTAEITRDIVQGLLGTLAGVFSGKGLPEGVGVVGPIGIVDLLRNSFAFGISHFLSFLATLSIYLAIFNALPIPAVDGGRLFFLGIEAVRKKPMGTNIEQRINGVFFMLLITFMIWVTIKDITRLFF
ncbi:MAG: site-2 protease family protein [bacterium]|nr:site-2 protease family protein [bacterium]